jgi:hypothetical protein
MYRRISIMIRCLIPSLQTGHHWGRTS